MPQPKGPRARSLTLDFQRDQIDVEARTVPLSVSSDSPNILTYVSGKGLGYEVLDHSSLASIDLSRFKGPNGGPLLFNHDRSQIIGRFMPTEVADGKLRGIARFGRSAAASEAFQDVQDNVLTDTSIYFDYDPDDVAIDTSPRNNTDFPTYRVKKWSLTEASIVPIPADITTGVGRSADLQPFTDAGVDASNGDGQVIRCATPGCTPETPCPECLARCQDAPRSQAAPAAATVPTPTTTAATGRTTREESPMTPEEIAAATQAAVQEGTIQALQLRNIAEAHGKGREAAEILAAKPLPEARAEIMALLATTPIPKAPSLEELGASKRELENFSYARLLNAVSQEGGRSIKCMELEISDNLAKEMPTTYERKSGVFAPFRLRKEGWGGGEARGQRAAMDSVTATAGKELVYTEPAELIEILRNRLFIAKLGARFLTGLRSPMGFSKQTGAAIANWIAENPGADATATEAATGLITLSPFTLIGAAQFSRQLLEVGTWDAEMMVRQDLAYSHAAAIDLAAVHGTGTNQPMGIYGLAGVNVVPMGGNPTYAALTTMLADIAQANALLGNVGWATNPLTAAKMLTTLEFAVNGASKIWQGNILEGQVCGFKATTSAMIKSNLGAGTNENGLVAGAWDQMIVGQFGAGFELITDPYKLKLQGLIEVSSFEMASSIVRHAEAFTKATGVILS